MEKTRDIEAEDLRAHVAACSVRYQAMRDRMRRIEIALYVLVGLVVANSDLPVIRSFFGTLKP